MNLELAGSIWRLLMALGNLAIVIFGVVLITHGNKIEGLLWILVANTNNLFKEK